MCKRAMALAPPFDVTARFSCSLAWPPSRKPSILSWHVRRRRYCCQTGDSAQLQLQRICKEAALPMPVNTIQRLHMTEPSDAHKRLQEEVQGELERLYPDLPVGRYGRDDNELHLWFLKDRKFKVDEAVEKLAKFIIWRQKFAVEKITEESLRSIAASGKAYLHKHYDREGRPVVVVVAAKHFPVEDEIVESQRLCVYLIEKALDQLTPGREKLLGIFYLRGFSTKNADLEFVRFLVKLFYDYYPKRLGEVLFVDAPFIFQPGWNMIRPWLKSYSSLVRFCSASVVYEEYFTRDTAPPDFIG